MKYQSVKGMEDILLQDVRMWQELERIARSELESSGYCEIRTPILEDTAVFTRSIGEDTDIVKKEMFTFSDRKDRSLTMRPEGTAPIVRAYIEHSLDQVSSESKLYCIGPMFRAERPQKGRLRQFHQVGVEIIGTSSHYADIEVITRLDRMLKAFGLDGFTMKINSLGCKDDKDKFNAKLADYLKEEKARLCEDCKARMERNILRVLDCKNESCIQVLRGAPNVLDSLCDKCGSHFEKTKKGLNGLGVGFSEAKNLVRGLDYYTGVVFEVSHPALGGQDALAAGGRYDALVREMGGPDVGAIGFAIGLERVILALGDKCRPSPGRKTVYIATLGDRAKIEGLKLAEELRPLGIVTLTDIKDASLKSQMRSADKNGSALVLILGDEELNAGNIVIKDMEEKGQIAVALASVKEEIIRRLAV